MRRMTPTSASWGGDIHLPDEPGVYGPMTMPARRYPTIGERPIFCVMMPRTHAAKKAAAMVVRSGSSATARVNRNRSSIRYITRER